ncbi:MAG: hypothetical protein JXB88_01430 [Spirochaetales bacterium]|nr:hypothetical protein [Spirochaetales bacterium]
MVKNEIIQIINEMPENSSEFDILKRLQEIILIKKDLQHSRNNIKNNNVVKHVFESQVFLSFHFLFLLACWETY